MENEVGLLWLRALMKRQAIGVPRVPPLIPSSSPQTRWSEGPRFKSKPLRSPHVPRALDSRSCCPSTGSPVNPFEEIPVDLRAFLHLVVKEFPHFVHFNLLQHPIVVLL